ncbi:HAD hydrolase family protein [Streptomyces hygroscopicus]|uniref:HAD hydrolase family protein n=1 Tax=Streptomyces hygroscopicus TaxID=1912 RepID=UPI000830C73A|nr:HAD family hydrolase [Streptomyces hygroscopicus]GLV77144.1 haloacid dehalogenase [Streptomyces hygroscopicus subsp. hygroscopicus]
MHSAPLTGAPARSATPLYVCDLDGTLLRPDATLSAYARAGLNRLLDAGVPLTIASARSVVAMRSLLAGVRLRLPVIELNGAFLSDLSSGRHLAQWTLDGRTAAAVMSALAEFGTEPVITSWDPVRGRDHVTYGPRRNEGTAWYVEEKRAYGDPRLRPADDVAAATEGDAIATVTAFVPDSRAPRLAARLEAVAGDTALVLAAANAYVPGWTEVQVAHAGAEKGAAVRHLVDVTGLGGARVTVCGDHLNDLPMFAVADRSVAPANAHPRVRDLATVVVGPNSDDGVVRFLLTEQTTDPAPPGQEAATQCSA